VSSTRCCLVEAWPNPGEMIDTESVCITLLVAALAWGQGVNGARQLKVWVVCRVLRWVATRALELLSGLLQQITQVASRDRGAQRICRRTGGQGRFS